MNLNHIRIFVRVAETGSFSEAARRLQLPKSQVSRQVRLLEEALGTRLFERTTRQVRLTESGQVYFQRCRVGLNDLEEANIRISGMQQELRGLIRVTAPVDVGPYVITGLITEFLVEYPQLEVELNCTQRVVNLIEEEYDLGICMGRSLPDSSLIARKLGAVSFQLFAGLALISGFFAPLALVVLAPIIVNILYFHLSLDPVGIPVGIMLAVLAMVVANGYRNVFLPLLQPRMRRSEDASVGVSAV